MFAGVQKFHCSSVIEFIINYGKYMMHFFGNKIFSHCSLRNFPLRKQLFVRKMPEFCRLRKTSPLIVTVLPLSLSLTIVNLYPSATVKLITYCY